MTVNLIAEFVKKGILANQVAKTVAKLIDVSEKTARNKLNGVTDFSVPEAVKINNVVFNGEYEIEYLFKNLEESKHD